MLQQAVIIEVIHIPAAVDQGHFSLVNDSSLRHGAGVVRDVSIVRLHPFRDALLACSPAIARNSKLLSHLQNSWFREIWRQGLATWKTAFN